MVPNSIVELENKIIFDIDMFCINYVIEFGSVKRKRKRKNQSFKRKNLTFLTSLVFLDASSLQFHSFLHSSAILLSFYPIYLVSSQIPKSSPRSSRKPRKWTNPRSENAKNLLFSLPIAWFELCRDTQ